MNDIPRRLAADYGKALEAFIGGGGEPALQQAYELGRQMMQGGLGVLDIASVYHEALAAAIENPAHAEHDLVIAAGAEFFNESISAFEMGYRGFQSLVAELENRVTERTAQLEAANHELEAFSYSVSHDLRAPLRSIDGFSLALLEDSGELLDEPGKEHLRRVRAASQRMAQLIDDLLKLARVTRAEMSMGPVDLSALARSIVAELAVADPDRHVDLVIADNVLTNGDTRLLRIMLENLLNNAWKFTGKVENPRIEFGTTDSEARPIYFVRDNGAGFDMTYASRLFGAFQRLHDASDFAGTGIGLATVQRVILRHGGRVWAEGTVGAGATFYFSL